MLLIVSCLPLSLGISPPAAPQGVVEPLNTESTTWFLFAYVPAQFEFTMKRGIAHIHVVFTTTGKTQNEDTTCAKLVGRCTKTGQIESNVTQGILMDVEGPSVSAISIL